MITFSPLDAISALGLAAKAIPFGAERWRDKTKRDRVKGHMVRAISTTPVGLSRGLKDSDVRLDVAADIVSWIADPASVFASEEADEVRLRTVHEYLRSPLPPGSPLKRIDANGTDLGVIVQHLREVRAELVKEHAGAEPSEQRAQQPWIDDIDDLLAACNAGSPADRHGELKRNANAGLLPLAGLIYLGAYLVTTTKFGDSKKKQRWDRVLDNWSGRSLSRHKSEIADWAGPLAERFATYVMLDPELADFAEQLDAPRARREEVRQRELIAMQARAAVVQARAISIGSRAIVALFVTATVFFGLDAFQIADTSAVLSNIFANDDECLFELFSQCSDDSSPPPTSAP